MKINIEIDATPEELRNFFGLPDVSDFQKDMMDQARKAMEEQWQTMGPDKFMEYFNPMGPNAVLDFQKHMLKTMGLAKGQGDT